MQTGSNSEIDKHRDPEKIVGAKKYILKHYSRTYRVDLPAPGEEDVTGSGNAKKPEYLKNFVYNKPIDIKKKLKNFLKHGYDEG